MNESSELVLENFRCFKTEQRGRLRPITLLVGENSTGKSSFMASYLVMDQCFNGPSINVDPDFNIDPFELGSFNDIAYACASTNESSSKFKIGLSIGSGRNGERYQTNVTFWKRNVSPTIHKIRHDFSQNAFIELECLPEGTGIKVPKESATFRWPLHTTYEIIDTAVKNTSFDLESHPDEFMRWIANKLLIDSDIESNEGIVRILTYIAKVARGQSNKETVGNRTVDASNAISLIPNLGEIGAFAPIRSKPKRTYDLIGKLSNPEGDHIPMTLYRLSTTNKSHWEKLRKKLIAFGESTGLFSDIRVKDYVEDGSGPFQIQVKVGSGKFTSVSDVGYGVSQCLSLVTGIFNREVCNGSKSTTFLLQQPEVHLHPRAHAEIGNLICKACAKFGNRFVIETHSDFIVDRVRVMVRRGVISQSDVSIIYFERDPDTSSVKLFNIGVDCNGNILDAPNSYRDFFVAETDRILGFRD